MGSYRKPIQGYTLSEQPVVERQKKDQLFQLPFEKTRDSWHSLLII